MNPEPHAQSSRRRNGVGQRGIGAVQRNLARLSLRNPPSQTPQDGAFSNGRTRIGLTELHSPSEPRIDFVFVHGLGGGSFKTWRKYDDPASLWPKAWISEDQDLHFVRTSTFGYQSDWLSLRDSILNVYDFGRKLLGELQTSGFLRRSKYTPIVLIGHSMGGLVIKRAYMLARQEAPDLAERIKAIVFLATPHRGSDSADLLQKVLEVTRSEKQYVSDLMKGSPSLEAINNEFPNYAAAVELWSFFEERKMRAGIKADFIVGRSSATLQLPGEKKFSLNANHREICKFESPQDENYVILRNALVTIVDTFAARESQASEDLVRHQKQAITLLLKIPDAPSADLEEQRTMQTPGTCEWIKDKNGFEEWLDSAVESTERPPEQSIIPSKKRHQCEVFWLQARPGTGKSICSGHVVSMLENSGRECCYFFFHHGIKQKTLLSTMLLSIAFQMAELHAEVREALHKISQPNFAADKDNDFAIWDRIFVGCVLKCRFPRQQYWVLDGLNECSAPDVFLKMLQKVPPSFPLRVFFTSRPQPIIEQYYSELAQFHTIRKNSILDEDTMADMHLYLAVNNSWQDLVEEDKRSAFKRTLLQKSDGCFLWLKLVCRELENVYSQESIESVLNEVPKGLQTLYARSLAQMSQLSNAARESRLLESMLTWAVCAVKPMKVEEFASALRTDVGFSRDLRQSIDRLCGNLLYVDLHDYVQLVHSTVRDFLFDKGLQSSFSIQRDMGHESLAMNCLKVMAREMRPPRSRSFGRGLNAEPVERSALVNYAATAFSEHIAASSTVSDQLLVAICRFLKSSILAWVEHIASVEPSLYYLTRTAKNFKQYLERRAKHVSPLGPDFKLVQDWATDLLRLVAKFGRNLQQHPSSIFFLIPSLAPRDSQLYQQSLNNPTWLEVKGAAAADWDDFVTSVEYRDTYASALGSGRSYFAIGFKNGMIVLHDQSTCQEVLTVQLRGPSSSTPRLSSVARLIAFDSQDEKFAACGIHSICVWSLAGEPLHFFELNEPQVAIAFSLDGQHLITVGRSSRVVRHRLTTIELELEVDHSSHSQRRRSSAHYSVKGLQLPRQAPLTAAISPDQTTVALLYRGKPIYLYNLEDNTLLGTCGRDVNSSAPNISVLTALFNPNPDFNLLAIAHQDGDLALFDPWTQKELKTVDGDAYSLAASPDGYFLGSGNAGGTVRLWEFKTLSLLYIIRSGLEDVRSLAFIGDGTRIVDRRESRLKVWEPVALIHQQTAEEDSTRSRDATTSVPAEVGRNEEETAVTVMCIDHSGSLVYAGRNDGSIVAYSSQSGSLIAIIQKEGGSEFIVTMASGPDTLAAAGAGQGVMVWRISKVGEACLESSLVLRETLSDPIQQLILSPDCLKILIATSQSDQVWDVPRKKKVKSLSHKGKDVVSSRWASLEPNIIALNPAQAVELYNWSFSEVLPRIELSTSFPANQNFEPTAVAYSKSSKHLVATFSQAHTVTPAVHLWVWPNPFSNETTTRPEMSLPPVAQLPSQYLKCFIGLYQDKVIFLDHDLWICSIDLADAENTGSVDIRRHIFIPPDFVASSIVVTPLVTPQGHIVFGRDGDLAIVQGALNFTFL